MTMVVTTMLCLHVLVLLGVVLAQTLLHQGDVNSYQKLSLEGDSWLLSTTDRPGISKLAASVPGSQFTALWDNHVIGDPRYRDNDVTLQWVANASWTYTRDFTVSASLAASKSILLVCEGLDTTGYISVNNRSLATTPDNMFTRYIYDVTSLVKEGSNQILVHFDSAVKVAEQRARQSSYVIPPTCPPDVQHGQCFVNQIRKEQCSFSWDWGPSLPTAGIWKPIYLEAYDSAILRQLSVVPQKVDGQWQISVDASFNVTGSAEVKGRLVVAVEGLNLVEVKPVTLTSSQSHVTFVLPVPQSEHVDLWWPNGYGNQTLYTVNATFTSGNDQTQRSQQIGFRTVEVVQVPVSKNLSQGLTFYFKVNGLPIFLKGSNWIPADNFQEKITEQRLRYLLTSAKDVGINSMRVWGGGVYESGHFYNLCDQLGIMVWQDLMFSVAFYPTYDTFLESVAEEIRQNVMRLKHHPSIILWAGNNENEKALRQDWFHVKQNFSRYYNDYVKLYVTTIKPVVNTADPSRQYLTSSPGNALDSEREGYVAKDPGSELYGDIHFYDYIADQWNDAAFRIPRMATEYGIQSWCNNESLATVFDPSDYDMRGKMADHRQHHAMGNAEMEAEVGVHLKMPSSSDAAVKFANFIYLTQINQAESMRAQTEHYRRHQASLQPDGRGLTMGALYWQLNDIWQAPTWASIDYEGRWKMLHYFAAKFFQPTLVSPYIMEDNINLDVFVVVDELPSVERRDPNTGALRFEPMTEANDLRGRDIPARQLTRVTGGALTGTLNIKVYRYDSLIPKAGFSIPYKMNTTAESVYQRNILDLLESSNCGDRQDCFVYFYLLPFGVSQWEGPIISWLPMTYPKDARLHPARPKITAVTRRSAGEYHVMVVCSAPALYVWLSAGDLSGHFSDNGFLQVYAEYPVTFFTDPATPAQEVAAKLTVKSLTEI